MADADQLILQTLMEIKSDLGRVEGSLDSLVTSVSTHMEDDKGYHEKASKRLGALERRGAYEKGIIVTASVLMTFVCSWIARQFGFHPGG